MSTEYHDTDEHEQELPSESNTRPPFSHSVDLYDNLGNGGDFTRRGRVRNESKWENGYTE